MGNPWPIAGLLLLAAVPVALAEGAARAGEHRLTLALGSRLLVAARVNGRPVTALLDSAAEVTLVDARLARSLKLRRGQPALGQGSGESTFEARMVKGVKLEAIGLSLPDQTVAVADLSDVGQRLLHRRLEVILGRELFDAARLAIDIERRRIRVVPRDREPRGVRLALTTEHGLETVPVVVEGGDPVRATFDLGNGSRVLISSGFAARTNLLTDGRPVRAARGGGLGGEHTREVLTLRSLELAGRRFESVPAAIDPSPSAADVNVGISVLRQFRITTDYAAHAVWLEAR